jgi:hypothetical protein
MERRHSDSRATSTRRHDRPQARLRRTVGEYEALPLVVGLPSGRLRYRRESERQRIDRLDGRPGRGLGRDRIPGMRARTRTRCRCENRTAEETVRQVGGQRVCPVPTERHRHGLRLPGARQRPGTTRRARRTARAGRTRVRSQGDEAGAATALRRWTSSTTTAQAATDARRPSACLFAHRSRSRTALRRSTRQQDDVAQGHSGTLAQSSGLSPGADASAAMTADFVGCSGLSLTRVASQSPVMARLSDAREARALGRKVRYRRGVAARWDYLRALTALERRRG